MNEKPQYPESKTKSVLSMLKIISYSSNIKKSDLYGSRLNLRKPI